MLFHGEQLKRFAGAAATALIVVTASALAPAKALGAQPEPVHVAVLQFRHSGSSASHAALVGNYLEMELLQRKEIVLLERGQIKKKYPVREANRYSCRDSSCAVLAGRALSADYVILGDVAKKRGYSVEVRVVSVAMEKIVYSCSADYDSEDGAKIAAGELAKKLMLGMLDASTGTRTQAGSAATPAARPVIVDIYANLAVFQPFERLGRLIGTSAGFTCGIRLSGMATRGPETLRRITAGFDTGVLYAPGIINSRDSGMLVPFSFSLGYLVPVIERIYFIPHAAFGFTYMRFHHPRGDGFDMEEGAAVRGIDPHLRLAALFGRPLVKNILLEASAAFWVLFESPDAPIFLTVHVGLTCRFDAE